MVPETRAAKQREHVSPGMILPSRSAKQDTFMERGIAVYSIEGRAYRLFRTITTVSALRSCLGDAE